MGAPSKDISIFAKIAMEIDGKKIAFTGDNLFADSSNPEQNGHEAVVARNSSIFEEGYLLGSHYLKELNPDIVMGAHSYVMPEPVGLLHRYHEWSKEIIRLYKDLLPETDYEYLYDPYWVSAYPYRVDFSQKEIQSVEVTVRNFRSNEQSHEITLVTPAGITADPPVLRGKIPAEQRATYQVNLRIDRTEAKEGLGLIPFDITLDGKHKGQWFDFIYRTNAGDDGK